MSSFAGGGGSGYVITGAISPLYYSAGNIGLHFTGPLVNFGGATGLGVSCATTAFDGTTRIATQAQAYYATPYSVAFGCPFVPSITNLLVRRESGSQALTSISTGAAPGARGTKAIDFQSTRGFAVQVASGSGATCFGSYNKASGTRGSSIGCYNNNVGLKSQAFGYQNLIANIGAASYGNCFGYGNNIPSANGCNCFGTSNTAGYLNCSAFGRSNTVGTRTGAVAFGHSNTCRGASAQSFGTGNIVGSVAFTATKSSAFGSGNNIGTTVNSNYANAVGYFNYAINNYSNSFGGKNLANGVGANAFGYNNNATGTNSVAFGNSNVTSAALSACFGLSCQATVTKSVAIGYNAIAHTQNTTVLQPPIIAPKGVSQANAFARASSVQNVFWTTEIDFTAAGATYTFTLPAGARFFFDEVGVIVEELDGTITTQPTYSFGITGTNAKYHAAVLGTNLNVLLQRDSYQNLLADVGESSMTFTITVPGVKNTATVYKGKAYIKGLLIELEP